MENLQKEIVSGSVFDACIAQTDEKFLQGRLPHVGQRVSFRDGREFVFCSTEEDFVAGEVVAVKTALATEFADKCVAAVAGATEVTLNIYNVQIFGGTVSTIALNRLAGGYLMLTDDAGEGYSYKIKGNTVQSTTDATHIYTTITLYDPLKVAVTTSTDCVLVGNPYAYVTEGAVALKPIGVAVVPTTGTTALCYFWAQTKGPGVALGSGTVGVEIASAASGAVADAAEAGSGAYDRIVGTGLATTANGYASLWLNL